MTEINIGEQGERVYLPFPIAEPSGLVDSESAMHLNQPPGVLLSNGIKPASSNGGALLIGEEVWGIDHVAVQTVGQDVVFTGTDKTAVEVDDPNRNIGIIREEGAIILTNPCTEQIVIGALIKINRGWSNEFSRLGLTIYNRGNLIIAIPNIFSKIPRIFDIKQIRDDEVITKPID